MMVAVLSLSVSAQQLPQSFGGRYRYTSMYDSNWRSLGNVNSGIRDAVIVGSAVTQIYLPGMAPNPICGFLTLTMITNEGGSLGTSISLNNLGEFRNGCFVFTTANALYSPLTRSYQITPAMVPITVMLSSDFSTLYYQNERGGNWLEFRKI